MRDLCILRKRFIPNEVVDISSDEVIYHEDNKFLVTRWKPIHARDDMSAGKSYYFIEKGYKISEIYDTDGKFSYWYCDIIDTEFDITNYKYVFTDLLADVVVFEDLSFKVVDLEEISECLDDDVITVDLVKKALRRLNDLLQLIYKGEFPIEEMKKY